MKMQAERLRLIRISKNMSQESVARALDLTVGAYSKLERGLTKLSLERIMELSAIFDVEANDFIRYINGESALIDPKRWVSGSGNAPNNSLHPSHSADSEVALLRKIINLYDESKELNTRTVIRNIFENNNINIPSFLEMLKESVQSPHFKKLDANHLNNYKRGVERLIELLA